ncbi:MAG: GNAT family N-acetyltransferase [Candidatus Limivicinus sp.]|jgi:ribosomal protein S18 acetylase RimI-like enzyme
MSDFSIREYRKEDIPQLSALWINVFGDSEEFVNEFFSALPDIGGGLAALEGDKIIGAAYVLTGQELASQSGGAPVLGYIYGVAVDESFRGKGVGSELVKRAAELGRKREAKIICTLPASDELYGWYEKLIGLKPVLWRERQTIKSEKLEESMPLSSTEYMLWREGMLKGKNHVRLSNFSLEFEKKLLSCYGGGYYATESGVAAAYVEDGKTVIVELVCMDRAAVRQSAASVGAILGTDEVTLLLPSEKGEKYIAADGELPKDCVWNLTFD